MPSRFTSKKTVNEKQTVFLIINGVNIISYAYIYIYDVKNVIYALQCNGCQEYYIGQTGDKLRSRRTVHAQQIRDPSTRQLPLSGHIDICCQTDPKFTMFPFYKMHSESISTRLAKEKHFIKCFNPKLNAL